jgi:pimeloyl-ACP methyl ester carboxylesterase
MQQIRLSDGTRIAFSYTGREDGPTILLCDGISCDGYAWRYLKPWLEQRFRILHMHYRGHGRSGIPRDPDAVTIPYLAQDADELMTHLGIDAAIAIGHSMGVQVILELALRRPERLMAIILVCGSSGRVLDTFKDTDTGMRMLPFVKDAIERFREPMATALRTLLPTEFGFQLAQRSELNRELIKRDDFMPYLQHFATIPLDVFVLMLQDAAERTSLHFLRRLNYPSLVLAGDHDGFTPAKVIEDMASRLPEGQYHLLEGGSHTAPIELPEKIQGLIAEFLESNGFLADDLGQAKATETQRPRSLAEHFRGAA